MSLCSNIRSYDTNQHKVKHSKKYVSKTARKQRKLAKKALRKYSRSVQKILIQEHLTELAERDQETATLLVETALGINWGLEHVIDMYEMYNVVSPAVKSLAKREYEEFMEGRELYEA